MKYADHAALLQLFVDGLIDYAVGLLDVDGKVLTWNAGGRAMLGYTAAEVVGRSFSLLYRQEDADKAAAALADATAHGRHEATVEFARKDGTGLKVQSLLVPLRDPEKALVGFGLLARNVQPAARAAAPAATQREQILVVDDDDAVRQVALNQLTSLGYRVLAAPGGDEALQILVRVPDIDLLFTDAVMPGGLSGRELAEEARRVRPNLKILFASGYFEGALVRNGTLEESVPLIVKPYRKSELAQKVRDVLSGVAA